MTYKTIGRKNPLSMGDKKVQKHSSRPQEASVVRKALKEKVELGR